MNDISDINWASMTDGALLKTVGDFVRHHRLNQNITQSQLAKEANISRSTLSLMEKGDKITFPTLIQVLRVLDQLHIMNVFKVEEQISPIEYAKLMKKKRQRASSTKDKSQPDNLESEW
ncbi:helix-turn-helix domain-containing protein [Marinifilum sp. RC60d5]|uniref:helix-turn-helix domain-containing protein n=1 Tax=Marinifilum sp. RC60d5 TaxID=3458414 RepID=UPI004035938C